MGVRLSHVRSNRRTFVLTLDGEEMKVTYRPAAYTPALEAGMRAATDTPWQAEELAKFVASLVEEWELLDDDGSQLDASVEVCQTLPVTFLAAVVGGIGEDMKPGEAGAPSGGG